MINKTNINRRHIFIVLAKWVIIAAMLVFAYGKASGQIYPPYNPQNSQSEYDQNYSRKSPFKIEVARLDASVYRPGEEPLPLAQVPRLNKGDVLKVKIAREAVNGIMPDQSKWDWTLLVAFINPSRNNADEKTLSQEIRLRERGWYNDNFFKVPYDSQPMIFLYPKPNYRKKILALIKKKPDAVRQMGEKIIDISSAYGHISSFLTQLQYMMARPDYYNNGVLEQSVEGMARSFGLRLPSCWNSNGYGTGYGGYGGYSSYSGGNNLQSRMQCISNNIRIDDLNFSVSQMLQQGGLTLLAHLKRAHPEMSKWIALAAMAIDFIIKITGKTAIKIIPVVVSTPDNPIYSTGFYNDDYNKNPYPTGTSYFQTNPNLTRNSFAQSTKVSLLANYQPNVRTFVTVFAYVPHKWQADPDPKIANLVAPKMIEPCLHSGKNMLRNMDLRSEWLSDNFTRDFILILTDNNGWDKEFELRKNTGLNAWEVDVAQTEFEALPRNNVLDARITGSRGFTEIESPIFKIPISNGGNWTASITPAAKNKSVVTLKRITGDPRCSQSIVYTPSDGKPTIFPLSKENSFLSISSDESEISFEIDSIQNKGSATISILQYGGERINVVVQDSVGFKIR